MQDEPGARWRGRAWLSRCLRLFVLLVPIAAAVAVSLALTASVAAHRQHGFWWWTALIGLPVLAAIAVGRTARRLLPLAALFKLSLIFPDQAPSRMRLALRSGTVRQLRQRIEAAKHDGLGDDPTQAAKYLLELIGALQIHDRRTRGHAERVRALTDLLAEELHLPAADRDRLHWAALLHDIGKVAVPHAILEKTDELTEAEWEVLRQHPIEGERLAAPLEPWLGEWAMAIGEHHERWDGLGYPRALAGAGISRAARIVGVADAFEVMTSARSYKTPVSAAAARRELTAEAGSQFDPEVVRAFLRISIGRLRWMLGPMAVLAQLPVSPKLRSAAQQSASAVVGVTAAVIVAAMVGVGTARSPADVEVAASAPPPGGAPTQTQTRAASASNANAGGSGVGSGGPVRELIILPSVYDQPAPEPASVLPTTVTARPTTTTAAPSRRTTTTVRPSTTTTATTAVRPATTTTLPSSTTTTLTPPTTSTPTTTTTVTTVKPAVTTTTTTSTPACPPLKKNQKGKDFTGVDFRACVNLDHYHFDKAILVGANLSGLDLDHTNFHDADLRNANLSGADLSHANLDKADLTGANLTGAKLPKKFA